MSDESRAKPRAAPTDPSDLSLYDLGRELFRISDELQKELEGGLAGRVPSTKTPQEARSPGKLVAGDDEPQPREAAGPQTPTDARVFAELDRQRNPVGHGPREGGPPASGADAISVPECMCRKAQPLLCELHAAWSSEIPADPHAHNPVIQAMRNAAEPPPETRECEGCGQRKPIEEMAVCFLPGSGESYQCLACRGGP